MRIAAISVYTADLPLAQPFRHASSGLIDRLEEVVVKVETADGAAGWSEVRGNAPYVTGETRSRVLAALIDLLIPRLLEDARVRPATVSRRLDAIVSGNTTAKAAIEIAVQDAAARDMGVPLRRMLGGAGVDTIPIHGTLPFCEPAEAARRTLDYLDKGIRTIKVRAGLAPIDRDLARLDAVMEALSGHPAGIQCRVAVDANQAWTAKTAIRALRAFERFDLAWAEQPVRADDHAGLKEVRDSTTTLVVADESCGTPEDLLALIGARAADGFHFKLCKAGGIGRLMGMIAIAEAAGLPYLVGQMDEGQLATAAALACAAASTPLSCELWGYQRVGTQPFSGLTMQEGRIRLPDGPGLGITVDEGGLILARRFEVPR